MGFVSCSVEVINVDSGFQGLCTLIKSELEKIVLNINLDMIEPTWASLLPGFQQTSRFTIFLMHGGRNRLFL